MVSIVSSGVGSGLDINSIISQLVQVQKQPQLQRLAAKEGQLQARLSGLGSLQSALSSLRDSVTAFTKPETFQARTATSGNPEILTAIARPGVAPGSYQVRVDELAAAHKLATDPGLASARFTSGNDIVGTGSLTVRFGVTTLDPETGAYTAFSQNPDQVAQTINITDGSLAGIASAINAAGVGISASIVFDGAYYRLALSGAETGAANGIEISVEDSDGNNGDAAGLSLLAFNAGAAHLRQTQAAQDTVGLVIDGIAMTSARNTLDKSVAGMTINLLAPGATTVTVAVDKDKALTAISGFVEKYNGLITTINRLSHFDANTGESGVLNGDGLLRSIDSQIKRAMAQISGTADSPFRQLADLGITRNAADGTLILDNTRLDQALGGQNYDAAIELSQAYGQSLDGVLSVLLASGGIFKTTTDGINRGILDVARQKSDVEQRSTAYEARITAQFTAMDALVAQLRSTGDFLAQQLDKLPTIGEER